MPEGAEFPVDATERGVISSSLFDSWVSHISVTLGAFCNFEKTG